MKMLIVAAHRLNRSPSQRFRFEQYLSFLKENGLDYHLSYIINEKDDKYFYSKGHFIRKSWILFKAYFKRWKDVFTCGQYDLVFVQREAIMTRTTIFERMLAKRKPLIFDFDDAIWKMDISDANQNLKWLKNPAKTKRIIKHAQHVIAGNDYLAQYARAYNDHITVIPTTVDTLVFKPLPKQDQKVIIGWSGSKTTIKHFELAVPVLKKIAEQYGAKVGFRVIGDSQYKSQEIEVDGVEWNAKTEVLDLNEIHIGIMPLPDDEWSKGKCGLKGLTYMALGIPTIMSKVGVNSEIIQHGDNGFLYANNDELYRFLVELIDQVELRQSIGQRGRETVVQRYSVMAHQKTYLQLLLNLHNDQG